MSNEQDSGSTQQSSDGTTTTTSDSTQQSTQDNTSQGDSTPSSQNQDSSQASTHASQSNSDDTFLGDLSKDDNNSNSGDNTSNNSNADDNNNAEGGGDSNSGDDNNDDSGDGEGYDLELSEDSPLTDAQFDLIADLAEKNGFSKDEADKLIKAFEDQHSGSKESFEKAQNEKLSGMRKELEDMPEFQGEKRVGSTALIKLAVDKLGNDDLVEALKIPEIGNNKHLAKFLMNIGSRLSDDSIIGGGAQPQQEASLMGGWYGPNGENKS